MKIYLAEMKSIQRLARRSRVLQLIASSWETLSKLSFMLILVINLLFLIFYQTNDKKDTDLLYPEADVLIEMLGIAQTFIAFIVMYAYIQQYHGAFYQMYLDKYQSD